MATCGSCGTMHMCVDFYEAKVNSESKSTKCQHMGEC